MEVQVIYNNTRTGEHQHYGSTLAEVAESFNGEWDELADDEDLIEIGVIQERVIGFGTTKVRRMAKIEKTITSADLHSIYQSYRHWIDDAGQQEDWWAGPGYDGQFTFDINFVLGYTSDDLEDTNDFGVWLYPVDSSDPNFVPMAGIDVTDEFKAYLEKENK